MEESTSPRLYGDPCPIYGALYKRFLEQPSQSTPSCHLKSSSSEKPPLRSMLVTGFGMRNLDSLQRALLDDEQRRQMLAAHYDPGEDYECSSLGSATSKLLDVKPQSKSTSFTRESEIVDGKSRSLEYLLGLAIEQAEEEGIAAPAKEKLGSEQGEAEEVVDERTTLAMRRARKYLQQHKIFQFFQFLIAHMLAELPDNPIEFLIDLLDRCLLYRSGFGNPPLLFEKPHLEQLFFVMDPMRLGFVELDQYETGMKTLGICMYDKNPPLSSDGLVGKDFFVEEAYDCLTDLFVDMVRRRGGQITPSSLETPPPTEVKLVPSFASSGGQ